MDYLLLVIWALIAAGFAWKAKWYVFFLAMLAAWVVWYSLLQGSHGESSHLHQSFLGFMSFSVIGCLLRAVKVVLFSKGIADKKQRRAAIIGLSLVLLLGVTSFCIGIVDFCRCSLGKDPFFAEKAPFILRDGGTTWADGFGYHLVCFSKLDGPVGPAIRFWFLPFAIHYTTEKVGVVWVLGNCTSVGGARTPQ